MRKLLLSSLLPYLLDQSKKAQSRLGDVNTRYKSDSSPVCDVDYLNQMAFDYCLRKLCPNDKLIAEEIINKETHERLLADNQAFMAGVLEISEKLAEKCNIDSYGGTWYFDPIDGTKGFLDGKVFSIGAAFTDKECCMVSGIVCANLDSVIDHLTPSLWIANGGILNREKERKGIPGKKITLAISRKHRSSDMVEYLTTMLDATLIEIDSMAKYVCVANGYCDAYIRESGQCGNGEDMLWDHLPGINLICHYGGRVADAMGLPPDCKNSDGTNHIYFNKYLIAAKNNAICEQLITILAKR